MYGSVFPYKRIRVDGSVSICGLFFTGKSAKEAGVENNMGVNTSESNGQIIKSKRESETMKIVKEMKAASLRSLEGLSGMENVRETLEKMCDLVATHEARITVLEGDKRKLENEAALVPSMLSKLLNQCDSDTKDYRVRIKQLESTLDDLKLELSDYQEKEISWELEKDKLRSSNQQPIAPQVPESPSVPKENGNGRHLHSPPPRQPHSPSGSPPVQARQRPASTLGWVQRGSRATSLGSLNNSAARASGKSTLPRVASVGSGIATTTPTVNNITKSFTSTADIRRQFDILDTNKNGYLSRDIVRDFYTGIDDYGVKKSDAEISDLLNRCITKNSERVSFHEFELLCLGVTRR